MIPDLSTSAKLAEHLKLHPPQSADFREFGRAVLIHLRMREKRTELLEKKVDKLGEALKAMAEMLVGNAEAEEAAAPPAAAPGSPADVNAAPTTATATPFPAGVQWQAPTPGAAAEGAAGADEEEGEVDERGIPKPDTIARVVSTAPIAPKPTGNGIKPTAS